MVKLVFATWVSGVLGLGLGWWARGAWRRFWNRLPKVEASEVKDEWPMGEALPDSISLPEPGSISLSELDPKWVGWHD